MYATLIIREHRYRYQLIGRSMRYGYDHDHIRFQCLYNHEDGVHDCISSSVTMMY